MRRPATANIMLTRRREAPEPQLLHGWHTEYGFLPRTTSTTEDNFQNTGTTGHNHSLGRTVHIQQAWEGLLIVLTPAAVCAHHTQYRQRGCHNWQRRALAAERKRAKSWPCSDSAVELQQQLPSERPRSALRGPAAQVVPSGSSRPAYSPQSPGGAPPQGRQQRSLGLAATHTERRAPPGRLGCPLQSLLPGLERLPFLRLRTPGSDPAVS
ncbi:hypothetical protein D9M72_332840 [compost metagenome]